PTRPLPIRMGAENLWNAPDRGSEDPAARHPTQDPARHPRPVPVHAAAHGFRQGKSCRTYVEPHIGREVVLRVDLKDFFPSIPARRVHALFSTLGYPEAVARMLTGLCTNAVPMSVARHGAETWLAAKRLGV